MIVGLASKRAKHLLGASDRTLGQALAYPTGYQKLLGVLSPNRRNLSNSPKMRCRKTCLTEFPYEKRFRHGLSYRFSTSNRLKFDNFSCAEKHRFYVKSHANASFAANSENFVDLGLQPYALNGNVGHETWFGGGVRTQSRIFLGDVLGGYGNEYQPSNTRIDIAAGYPNQTWSVVAGIKNLMNRTLILNNGNGGATLDQARTLHVTFKHHF